MKAKYSCPHCGGPMNVEVTEVSVKITRESTSRKLDPAMSLVVYQSTNRAGRHDATGAFKPEALEYKRLHSVSPKLMLPIPHGLDAVNKARKVLGALRGIGDGQLDAFVYFGHGTTKSFPSMGFGLGFSGDRDVRQLAAEIARVGGGNIFVCLYACLTGKGFGSSRSPSTPEKAPETSACRSSARRIRSGASGSTSCRTTRRSGCQSRS